MINDNLNLAGGCDYFFTTVTIYDLVFNELVGAVDNNNNNNKEY